MMMRRSSAVLDTPEQRYASGKSGPRRVAGALRRDLQDDFGTDFDKRSGARSFGDKSFEESLASDDFDDFDADLATTGSQGRRRVGLRGNVRPGILGRIKSSLPQTLWGRIAASVTAVAVLGMGVGGAMWVRSALLHDARFVVPSSAAIAVEGNKHVTRAQLLSIFGGDVDRNIFTVSLAERRADLERLPWVEHATVMRLLPDHLRVSIVERTPVAFVRQGGHIGLVDKTGVLMDMVSGAGEATGGGAQYSFPVLTGIAPSEPLSTRSARMKIFDKFTADLDSDGRKISQGLSEVDLSDPEDVKAMIPDEHSEVMVHFGDTDFLDRYDKYKAHLSEWRTQYPKLASVDMRYDRQVVLEMQPGSVVPVAGTQGIPEAAKAAPVAAHPLIAAHTAPKLAPKPAPKAVLAKAATPAEAKITPAKAPVPVKDAAPQPVAQTTKPTPVPTAAPAPKNAGAPAHLSVAKEVPMAKQPAVAKASAKHPPAKRVVAKKVAPKRVVARKVPAKAGAATHHPSTR
ncbi:MAG: hypothetical protein JWM43_353 [Acidobacteriaceae bacterium]|nr:hypothetical protein [Acidobacteriaceae bacterium]